MVAGTLAAGHHAPRRAQDQIVGAWHQHLDAKLGPDRGH
jgi:hypothetical protein